MKQKIYVKNVMKIVTLAQIFQQNVQIVKLIHFQKIINVTIAQNVKKQYRRKIVDVSHAMKENIQIMINALTV